MLRVINKLIIISLQWLYLRRAHVSISQVYNGSTSQIHSGYYFYTRITIPRVVLPAHPEFFFYKPVQFRGQAEICLTFRKNRLKTAQYRNFGK